MRLHLFDHGHRPHLLIVSGSPALARALSLGASPERFECSVAMSRADGLRSGSTHEFAGYVIDASLPDGHGSDLVRDLRDARITVPILLLDSLSEASPAKNDADATLVKPISLPEFRASLYELFLAADPALSSPAFPKRKIASFHLSTLLIPILLGAGIALTYWLLSST